MALAVTGAVLSFAGSLLMEAGAKRSMRALYASLYDHMLSQAPAALGSISSGELMSRTSGDAAVLYSLVTFTTYRVIEGAFLTFGSLGFLMVVAQLHVRQYGYDGWEMRVYQVCV